jgi:hypothetical protein
MRVARQAITQHALAWRVEATQPLDVDVHQLTRPGSLVSARRLRRATRKPRAAMPVKHLPHRRGRPAKQPRHDHRPRIRIATSSQDLHLRLHRQAPRLTTRHRRAITHTLPASVPIPPPPPIRRRATSTRRLRRHPSLNQPHHTKPRLDRIPHPSRRLTTVHHSGPPWAPWALAPQRLPGGPDNVSRLAGV